jgi:cysteine-rich repeat protein
VLDTDEACDDGNTVDDDECSNACTSAICGDGIVQTFLGETCDDGNTQSGDTCTSSCIAAGTVIWSRLYDFDPCVGYSLVIASNGDLAATANCDASWRILGFDPEGELLWNWSGVTEGASLAAGPSDAMAIGGRINATQGQLRRFDADGNFLWSRNFPAASAATAVAIDGNDAVIAGGNVGTDRLLRRYIADGTLDWEIQPTGGERLIALATNASGFIWSLRQTPFQLETNTFTGATAWSSGLLGSSTHFADIAIDESDSVFVVGQTSVEWVSFYVSKYNVDGNPVWTELHDDPENFEIGHAIAVLPNNGVLIAGITNNDGVNLEADGWLTWISPDGVSLQDVEFDGEQNNDADVLHDVVVSSDGYAIAIGYHYTVADGNSLWLVKVAI